MTLPKDDRVSPLAATAGREDARILEDILKVRDALEANSIPEPLVIWHKGCLDGFTSAWVVHKYFACSGVTAQFHPGVYQEKTLPDVAGRDVVMVDFSYPAPVIEEMSKTANSIIILDHHKSAEAALAKWVRPFGDTTEVSGMGVPGNTIAFFDMSRSGAGLAWDFFFPGEPVPAIVRHVQDRDLWKFALEYTEDVCTALYSYDFDFETWDALAEALDSDYRKTFVITEGRAINKAKAKERAQLKSIARPMTIAGWPMPVVNAPWWHASELGNELATDAASRCAATYHDDENGMRKFSLRSVAGGPDVSEIAKKFGGGGHMRAAGFVAPTPNWTGDGT